MNVYYLHIIFHLQHLMTFRLYFDLNAFINKDVNIFQHLEAKSSKLEEAASAHRYRWFCLRAFQQGSAPILCLVEPVDSEGVEHRRAEPRT